MALANSYYRSSSNLPVNSNLPAASSAIVTSKVASQSGASGLKPTNSIHSRTGNTAAQYQRSQVETASPTRLVILLHEGAIRFCQTAQDAMVRQDLQAQHTNLCKAQGIVSELLGSLNREKGGEVAENLSRLYIHMLDQLVKANLYDQSEPIEIVQAMLRDLRASWIEVEMQTNTERLDVQDNSEPKNPLTEAATLPSRLRLGDRNA